MHDSQADSAAAKASTDRVNNVGKVRAWDLPKLKPGKFFAFVHGNSARLIDPDTMLIYSEERTRVMNIRNSRFNSDGEDGDQSV